MGRAVEWRTQSSKRPAGGSLRACVLPQDVGRGASRPRSGWPERRSHRGKLAIACRPVAANRLARL